MGLFTNRNSSRNRWVSKISLTIAPDHLIETLRNATLAATVKIARRLLCHRIVCIWNAPNRQPDLKLGRCFVA